MTYQDKRGWGKNDKMQSDIIMLNLVESEQTLTDYTLTRIPDGRSWIGEGMSDFENHIQMFYQEYNLETRSENAKDILLIFTRNLNIIRRYFNEFITFDAKMFIQCGNIEFRSWSVFSKKDEYAVMEEWQKKFIESSCAFLTPAQYMRKTLKKEAKGCAVDIYPDSVPYLRFTCKAVHGGFLYNRPEEGIIEDLLGFDICSAYIHSLVFNKHASTALQRISPEYWEDYLKKEDRGSIGLYQIEYNSIFRGIKCFKDVDGKQLKCGKHTVSIVLSNLDLATLFECVTPGIISVECIKLFAFKLDYLPKEFRFACAKEFIKKETLERGSTAQKNQKVILNAGFYGNATHKAKRICEEPDPNEQKKMLKNELKEAYIAPQWGIFTMSYTKQSVVQLGLQVSGWHYSDTDSIYCDDDTYNRKLFSRFNATRLSENIRLCEELGYNEEFGEDAKHLHKLGIFKLEAEIKRFRAWGQKFYAYETIEGKVVVKASGIPDEDKELDSKIVFNPSYCPERH